MAEQADPSSSLCKVCGDKSTGRHFGVHTCEACKAFYRRTAKQQSKLSRTIIHPCAVRHVINRYNRKECAPCRFDKCLRLGMSRDNCVFGKPAKKPNYVHQQSNADIVNYADIINVAINQSGLVFELELNERTKYLIAANNRRLITYILDRVPMGVDADLRAELIRKIWDNCELIQHSVVNFEKSYATQLSKQEKAVLLLSLLFAIEPISLIGEIETFSGIINCTYQTRTKADLVKFFGLLNEVYFFTFAKSDNNVRLE